jgi:uncharacterized protein YkwD
VKNSPKQNAKLFYVLIILIIAESLFIFSSFTEIGAKFKSNLAAILPSILVLETNKERQAQDLSELTENELLNEAAQLKANEMAEKGFFAHVGPDGKQPWTYLDQVGYRYASAGENLAVNFVHSKEVHKAWMNSPTHRANIIQPKFTEIGIATAEGIYKGQEAVFVVQFFAKPKNDVFYSVFNKIDWKI